MAKTADENRLGTESIWKLMFQLGIPALVAQLINLLYNVVDRIYIGRIPGAGVYALTGVGLCMPIISLLTAFSGLVGYGGSPRASIALGEGDKDRAEKIVGNSFSLLLLFAVVLTVGFLTFKKPVLYAFGASDNTFGYANEYLSIYLLGTVFVMISLGMNTYITAQGRSQTAMLSVLIGAVANIILDPVLIFGFQMGVRGAAVATVLSQAMSAAWILKFLTSDKSVFRIRFQNMPLQGSLIFSILSLGVSPFIMSSTESLVSIAFNRSMSVYGGDLYVGSITIMQSVMQLLSIPSSGFTHGVAPILSYNFGAGNRKRCLESIRSIAVITIPFYVLFCGSVMLKPVFYAGIFTTDAELLALVPRVMPIFFGGMLIMGIQMTCQTCFMALGEAKSSLFFALYRKIILLVPLILILPILTHSVYSIYWAEPLADAISALTCGTVFCLTFRKILDRRCPR